MTSRARRSLALTVGAAKSGRGSGARYHLGSIAVKSQTSFAIGLRSGGFPSCGARRPSPIDVGYHVISMICSTRWRDGRWWDFRAHKRRASDPTSIARALA